MHRRVQQPPIRCARAQQYKITLTRAGAVYLPSWSSSYASYPLPISQHVGRCCALVDVLFLPPSFLVSAQLPFGLTLLKLYLVRWRTSFHFKMNRPWDIGLTCDGLAIDYTGRTTSLGTPGRGVRTRMEACVKQWLRDA